MSITPLEALHWALHNPAAPGICVKPCRIEDVIARHRAAIEWAAGGIDRGRLARALKKELHIDEAHGFPLNASAWLLAGLVMDEYDRMPEDPA